MFGPSPLSSPSTLPSNPRCLANPTLFPSHSHTLATEPRAAKWQSATNPCVHPYIAPAFGFLCATAKLAPKCPHGASKLVACGLHGSPLPSLALCFPRITGSWATPPLAQAGGTDWPIRCAFYGRPTSGSCPAKSCAAIAPLPHRSVTLSRSLSPFLCALSYLEPPVLASFSFTQQLPYLMLDTRAQTLRPH
jgi:hypothetical protein